MAEVSGSKHSSLKSATSEVKVLMVVSGGTLGVS